MKYPRLASTIWFVLTAQIYVNQLAASKKDVNRNLGISRERDIMCLASFHRLWTESKNSINTNDQTTRCAKICVEGTWCKAFQYIGKIPQRKNALIVVIVPFVVLSICYMVKNPRLKTWLWFIPKGDSLCLSTIVMPDGLRWRADQRTLTTTSGRVLSKSNKWLVTF